MEPFQKYLNNIYENGNVFIYGIFTGLVILIFFKIAHVLLTRKKCYGISIDGEHGELFITSGALKDFVVRVLAGEQNAFVENVSLKKRKSFHTINIFINVLADTNVSKLRAEIEEKILTGLQEKIGIESVNKVNITLKNFSASEKKISKRNKLISSSAGYETLHDEEQSILTSPEPEQIQVAEIDNEAEVNTEEQPEEKSVKLIRDDQSS